MDDFFSPENLAPGIVLFGFVMLMFSSAMILARDRETALFARLLTAPLAWRDFLAAYSLPYLAIAVVQSVVVFAIAGLLGLGLEGNFALVVLVLAAMALLYVGLGVILGGLLRVAPLSGAYSAVLVVTIFAGTWFDLDQIGGPVRAVEGVLPFLHALDATRAVLNDGAGLADIASGSRVGGHCYALAAVAAAGAVLQHRLSE